MTERLRPHTIFAIGLPDPSPGRRRWPMVVAVAGIGVLLLRGTVQLTQPARSSAQFRVVNTFGAR